MLDHLTHMAVVRPDGQDRTASAWAIVEITRLTRDLAAARAAISEAVNALSDPCDACDFDGSGVKALQATIGSALFRIRAALNEQCEHGNPVGACTICMMVDQIKNGTVEQSPPAGENP